MNLVNSLFRNENRRMAYYDFLNVVAPQIIVDLQNELRCIDFHTFVEPVIEFNSPAIKIVVSNDGNIGAVFVLFDSIWGTYAVGQKSLGDNFNSRAFHGAEDAAGEIKNRLRSLIVSW